MASPATISCSRLSPAAGRPCCRFRPASVTLADKQAITRALFKSGARIGEMNAVRKHLSAIKGGRLPFATAPARVVTLIISDVPGDDLSVIALRADGRRRQRRLAEAREVLARYRIDVPPRAAAHLADPSNETPKPGDPGFARVENRLIATPRGSLPPPRPRRARPVMRRSFSATRSKARRANARSSTPAIALSAARHGEPVLPPCVLLSGGETTVTIKGRAAAAATASSCSRSRSRLTGAEEYSPSPPTPTASTAARTTPARSSTPDTLARARALGLDPQARLDDNDSYSLFAALGDLVVTGPTLTNVDDFRAILVETA